MEYSKLIEDLGLLTDKEVDRLTYNECSKHKYLDYREMFENSDFLNDTDRPTYVKVAVPPKAFVPAREGHTHESSYVDRDDLIQVIQDFYDGTLDDCDDYLDRLYRPFNQLNPANSLWGQVDADTVRSCLNQLDSLEGQVIAIAFDPSNGTEYYSAEFLGLALDNLAVLIHKHL